ncbi:hypothetical protein LTR37_010710 [Vermiconidia calcicola]|uniref:Uncharacterized protein n=1 Tax=Vermiconidia calcicola TaxID=1690605 RepID=A0ACC3N487_9PEZI|nr:hypothetical protein LTR37_010710 [Vermiconidia calcicola]
MRRQLKKDAESLITAVRHDFSQTLPRTPFICSNCRRAALQRSGVQPIPLHRSFASIAPRRQQTSAPDTEQQHHQRETIAPQTHYDFFPQTFPEGQPPKAPFTPDLRRLRKEFLQIQAKTHPDLAPQHQKRQAEALSMRVNEAYKTLQDPLKRAQYLLSLRGIDVEDESAKLSEKELLMEVMEAREAVEEVENEEDLVEIRKVNSERIDQSVAVLEKAFADGHMERAAQEAIRLRYWMNIEESIQGWEKGQGGGILHH